MKEENQLNLSYGEFFGSIQESSFAGQSESSYLDEYIEAYANETVKIK